MQHLDWLAQHLHALGQSPQNQGQGLAQRLALGLRQGMQARIWRRGQALPSSRAMAQALGLARNTVNAALAQLEAEGYVQGRAGSGTYVRMTAPIVRPRARSEPPLQGLPSQRGQALLAAPAAHALEVQPMTQGLPDFSLFPMAVWQRLLHKHGRLPHADWLYGHGTGGFGPLKRAIATHLRMQRGLQLEDEQVLVTRGTQQSLALCAALLADAGDAVWTEDPLHWGAAQTFRAAGLTLLGLPVDEQGLRPGAPLPARVPPLLYLTPSHQYPTGAQMSAARRRALLAWLRPLPTWVLEDDDDSEFCFAGAPLPALHRLDGQARVFYLGTFSKTLYPGIELAYLVVPPNWVAAFGRMHDALHRSGQWQQQAALAEFIEMGHYHATLRAARQQHALRRQTLVAALAPCVDAGARLSGAEQGLHLCLHLPAALSDVALAQRAAEQGLTVRPLSAYALQRRDASGLVVGYGHTPLAALARDAPRLARLVRAALLAHR
ncbi:MAG: PLP-dependent aminotransferase family protein [Limnohabitans sp.]